MKEKSGNSSKMSITKSNVVRFSLTVYPRMMSSKLRFLSSVVMDGMNVSYSCIQNESSRLRRKISHLIHCQRLKKGYV